MQAEDVDFILDLERLDGALGDTDRGKRKRELLFEVSSSSSERVPTRRRHQRRSRR